MTRYLIPKFYTTASLLKNIARKEQTYFLGRSLGKLRFSKSQKIRPKAMILRPVYLDLEMYFLREGGRTSTLGKFERLIYSHQAA